MAFYTEEYILNFGVDYESGRLSRRALQAETGVSRQTMKKWSDERGWVFGRLDKEIAEKIEEKAVAQLVAQSTEELVDTEKEHLKNLKQIENLTKFNLSKFFEAAKICKEVTKSESETLHAAQKFINEALKTLSGSFLDKRKILGLDREDGSVNNIQINNDTTPLKIEIVGIDADGPPPE